MTSLRTFRASMAAALVAVGTIASFAITTQAKDLSLPYRSYPGFTCHRWNAQQECVDFSYFEGAPSYPSYPGPSYPTYPAFPSSSRTNLTVSVTASDDEVDEDEQIVYRITVRNNSTSSQRVDVRGYLDEDTEFVRASDGGDDEEDDEVVWDNLNINARSSRTVTLTVRTDDDLHDGDTLRFRAEAGNDEDDVDVEVDTDSNNDDDDDDEDCDDSDCDVTVRVTASDDEVEENDLLTYSIYVRNDDSRDQRVDVRGFLDSDTTFYSISDGGRRDGDEVEWDNILVGRRSSRTLAVTVRVDNNVDDGDTLTFRAEAGDDEDEIDVDVDSDNDDDDEDCDNDDDCDVTVNVTASPTNPGQDQIVTFHIVLRNHDNDRKTVDVRGLLDNDLAFYSASDRGEGSSNDDEVEWDNISINGDSSRSLSVSARVRSQADNGDSLRFKVEAGDDEDSVTVRVR